MSKDCCQADKVDLQKEQNKTLTKVFWAVLVINLVMFIVELVAGYLAHSNALVADSLDMLGDVFVYALSIFVISKSHTAKANASLVKGIVMTVLGLYVVAEAVYKIANPTLPIASTISIIGIIALIANAICFFLLIKHKHTDLNVKSAWICSRNDVMANVSVIVAGLLVGYFSSMWPDIIVGLGIAAVVIHSSVGIIRESLQHKREEKVANHDKIAKNDITKENPICNDCAACSSVACLCPNC